MLPVVRAVRLTAASATADDIKGRVLVHDVSHELRKGSVLRPEDLEAVRRASEIHVVELEPGDVHEDVAAERLKRKARELFSSAVTRKLGWYGAEVLAVREVARTPEAVAAASREAESMGAQLVLFAGASAIDPLDPAYAELVNVGGELLQLGAPMHPGSMLWLGRLPGAAVVRVASRARVRRARSLDPLLPLVFAYGRADAKDLLRLGHGGLIESGAGRRFPPYS